MGFPDQYKQRVKSINAYLMNSIEIIENKKLKAAMAHYPSAGGKRLRPLLATVACEAVGGSSRNALPFGVALEMIHNFTLVHDDVMDEDLTRRGIKTVHAAYGIPEAILAGDALFARAFELVPESGVHRADVGQLSGILGRAVRLLAEGQQMDMDFEDLRRVRPADYMKMIELKTAVLFSAAAQGGCIIGEGTKKQEEALTEYGRLIGLGFQIWDDVLDLISDEKSFGKPVLNDIRNGKKTLMVIEAMEDLRGREREELLSTLGNEHASQAQLVRARNILDESGMIDHAINVANGLIRDAKKKLAALPESKNRTCLEQFAEYMVTRKT
jgi:geranylgeranyl diphosphate synthase type I